MFAKSLKFLLMGVMLVSFAACNSDLRAKNTKAPSEQEVNTPNDIAEITEPKTPVDTDGEESTIQCISDQACQMQDAINQVREENGKSRLKFDAVCGFVSQEHAEDMFFNSYIDHENLAGQRIRDRYEENGEVTLIYENITHGTDNIDVAINEWMSSASHRAALLSDEVTHHGIGVWGEGSNTYWVHCLIKP